MTLRTTIGIAVIVLAGTGGEIAVSHAMKRIGEVRDFRPRALLRTLRQAIGQVWIWVGVALMALAFFALLTVLSWADVSFVVPATALSYAVGAVGARVLLGEQVSRIRWLGVLLVCAGVALVWMG
ncbi:MAG TPA: EamA family transporter [Vicinamibacterales bacterium]|nr:EamA family transporter [Vicinamibacterales bacterium]